MAGHAPKSLRPEDEISHYRIISALGAGGMGEVYLAQDQTLERNVALKILPPDLVRSEERVRRFVLEAKSASSLSHPNIVTIYEIGEGPVRSPGEPPSDPVHFIWRPDNKRILIGVGTGSSDAVLIRNFR